MTPAHRTAQLLLLLLLCCLSTLSLSTPFDSVAATSCSSFTDCGSCTASSALCHFCAKDQRCHAIGSPGGCLVGQTCDSSGGGSGNNTGGGGSNSCLRTHNEYLGTESPPASQVAIFVTICLATIGVVALCCITALWSHDRKRARSQLSRFHSADRIDLLPFVQQRSDDADNSVLNNGGQQHRVVRTSQSTRAADDSSLEQQQSPQTTVTITSARRQQDAYGSHNFAPVTTSQRSSNAQQQASQRFQFSDARTPFLSINGNDSAGALGDSSSQPQSNPVLSLAALRDADTRRPLLLRLLKQCGCCTLIFCFIFILLGIIYFPQQPKYSLCSRNTDWSALLSGLVRHGKVDGDMSLLLSIYNPNRFGLQIYELDADVFFQDEVVGSGKFAKELDLDAGSVNDAMLLAEFSTSLSTGARMAAAQLSGSLLVDLQLKIRSSLWLFERVLPSITANVALSDVDLSKQLSRQYCKCPS